MRCHDEPAPYPLRSQGQIRAVVERAHHPAFWMGQMLIRRQFQASLDLGALQELRVFPTHHKRQSGQVGKDGSCAILPVKAQQNTFFGVVMGLSVALNGCDGPTQFSSVLAVARVSKRAQKLMSVGLQDRGTAPHHLSALASRVAHRMRNEMRASKL